MALNDLLRNLGKQTTSTNNKIQDTHKVASLKNNTSTTQTRPTVARTTQTTISAASPIATTSQVTQSKLQTTTPITYQTNLNSQTGNTVKSLNPFEVAKSNAPRTTNFATPTPSTKKADTYGGFSGKWVDTKALSQFGQSAVDYAVSSQKEKDIINNYENSTSKTKNSMASDYQIAKDKQMERILSQKGLTINDFMNINPTSRTKMLNNLGLNNTDAKYMKEYVARNASKIQSEKVNDFTDEHKVLGSLASIPVNAMMSLGNTVEKGIQFANGTPMNTETSMNINSQLAPEMRATASQNLGNVGNFLYETAMSMGDMGYNALTGGNLAAIGMGIEKASDVMNGAAERGLSNNQILAEGVASGVSTAITEKLPFDAILKGSGSTIKSVVKAALSEGGQEIAEDVVDTIADKIIAKDKSEMALQLVNLVDNGMDEGEAEKTVVLDFIKQCALDGLGGAISGGALAGVGSLGRNTKNVKNPTDFNQNEVNEANTKTQTAVQSLVSDRESKSADLQNKLDTTNYFDREVSRLQKREAEQKANLAEEKRIADEKAHYENVAKVIPTKNVEEKANDTVKAETKAEVPTVKSKKPKMSMKGIFGDVDKNGYIKADTKADTKADSEVSKNENSSKLDNNMQFFGSENDTSSNNINKASKKNKNFSEEATDIMVEKRSDKLFALDEIKRSAESTLVDALEKSTFLENVQKNKFKGQIKNTINTILSTEKLNTLNSYEDIKSAYADAKSRINQIAKNLDADGKNACNEALDTLNKAYEENLKLIGYDTKGNKLVMDKTLSNTINRSTVLSDVEKAMINDEDYKHVVSNISEMQQKANRKEIKTIVEKTYKKRNLDKQDIIDVERALEEVTDTKTKLDLLLKTSKQISKDATNMRMWQEMRKSSAEGAYVDLLNEVARQTDEKHYKGFSYTVKEIVSSVRESTSVEELRQKLKMNLQFFAEQVDTAEGRKETKEAKRQMKDATDLVNKLETLLAKIEEEDNVKKQKKLNDGSVAKDFSKLKQEAINLIYDKTGVTEISDTDQKKIYKLLKEAETVGVNSKEGCNKVDEAAKIMADYTQGGLLEKIRTWRYMCMLANPTTHMKNVISNYAFQQLGNITENVAGIIETAETKFNKNMGERENTILTRKDRELRKACADYFDKNDYGRYTSNGSKYITEHTVAAQRKQLIKPLQKVADWNSSLLEVEDIAAGKSTYADRLARYIKANGKDISVINSKEQTDILFMKRASDYALEEANKYTFHENNRGTEVAKNISNELSKMPVINFLYEGLLPFKKTPINITKQMLIDYNPIAQLGSAAVNIKRGDIPEANKNIAKTLTSSSVIALGYALRSAELVTAPSDEEDEGNILSKIKAYSLKVGNVRIPLAFIQPVGTLACVGVALADEGFSFDSLKAIADNLLDSSFLTGVSDTVEAVQYTERGENGFLNALASMGSSYAGQFIPTVMGKVATATTGDLKDPYHGDYKGWKGTVEENVKKNMNKVLVLRNLLPNSIDKYGNEKKSEGSNVATRLAKNLLDPTNAYTVKEQNEVEKEFSRLGKSVKDEDLSEKLANVFKSASQSIDGMRISGEEYSEYAKLLGKTRLDWVTNHIKSDAYNELKTDEEKIKSLQTLGSQIETTVKRSLYGNEVQQYLSKKAIETKNYDIETDITNVYEAVNEIMKGATDETKAKYIADNYSKFTESKEAQYILDDIKSKKKTYKDLYNYFTEVNDTKLNKEDFKERTGLDYSAGLDRMSDSGVKNDTLKAINEFADKNRTTVSTETVYQYSKVASLDKNELGKMYEATSNGGKLSSKAQVAYENKGYSGVADYYKIKYEADDNGNGSITKQEFKDYAKETNMSDDMYKFYYYSVYGWKK